MATWVRIWAPRTRKHDATSRYLHVLVDSGRPGQALFEGCADFQRSRNRCSVSVVSEWEVAIQASLGRLRVGQPLAAFLPAKRLQHGIELLELSENAVLYIPNLPQIHRDPFDRILVCQAITEGVPIMTPDRLIAQYPVMTIW
jgi:PIN domain nuclease of toxin-antitoxin system